MDKDKLQEIEDYFAKQIVHPKIGNYVYELIKGVKDLHWHNGFTSRCNAQLGESKRKLIEENQTLQQENQRYKQALEEIADSREGSFQATTGEGHNKCVWIAKNALKGETNE
jgi:regulator of replication initiation timing